jgi:adenosyl cobinamide kinase/adenosyl cobinamide phosphate guanylyltransferase
MSRDVALTVGPRRSGKSEFAEGEALVFEQRVYFATLRGGADVEELIERHEKRRARNPGWILVETSGEVDVDIARIREVAGSWQSGIVLCDGLTTWACTCAEQSGGILLSARQIVVGLVQIIDSLPNLTWSLVDVRNTDLQVEDRAIEAVTCSFLAESLRAWMPELAIRNYPEGP